MRWVIFEAAKPTPAPPTPSATPSPTPWPTPVPPPPLSVGKVEACWLKGGAGLRVDVAYDGQNGEPLSGYVSLSGVITSLSFYAGYAETVAGQNLKQGDYVLYIVIKTPTRTAERTVASGVSAC
jgi:hypothetical protein